MKFGLAVLTCLTLAAGLTAPVLAQPVVAQTVPKPGGEYEDAAVLGFKIKVPEGWDYVPPQPGEDNLIGRYTAGNAGYIVNQKNGQPLFACDVQLLKFVRTPKAAEAPATEERPFSRPAQENFTAWLGDLRGKWKADPKKDLTVAKVATVRHCYLGDANGAAVRFVAFEYKLRPDCDIVALFYGPAEDKKWGKFENAFDAMGKSFKPLALEAKGASGPRSDSPRDMKRFKIETDLASQPGWKLYETGNYFVVSAKNDDKQFMEEILVRLEAIRQVYETIYPPAFAAELRVLAKTRKANEEAKEGPATSGDGKTVSAGPKVDPMELSKTSVVRVCKDQEQYHSYGGPGGSAGYWNWVDEELVIYDDQKSGGRRNTWAVLNHEAFHQYVFYFFGQLSPHSWFNEGTGDFFSGYQLEHNKFTLKPFDWRQRLIQGNVRDEKIAPLKELVRWTQAEYYGTNKYDLDGGDNYAQGWSFIYFLRTAKKSSKCWNPAWENILDTYLRTLVETDDLDAAVDKAFADVDWDALEKCWQDYTLDG